MPNVLNYLAKVSALSYVDTMAKVWNDSRVQAEIVRLNTEEQLFNEGIKSDGDYLPDYSDTSVNLYGKPNGHIRLYDTGEFFESFRILVFGEDAEIVADTRKEDTDLAERYGKAIIGLTNESKDILTKIILQVLREVVRKDILTL